MLSTVAKNVIVRSLVVRKGRGEDPEEILKGYVNLTDSEKGEISNEVKEWKSTT